MRILLLPAVCLIGNGQSSCEKRLTLCGFFSHGFTSGGRRGALGPRLLGMSSQGGGELCGLCNGKFHWAA